MKTTVMTPDIQIIILELDQDESVENRKALLEIELSAISAIVAALQWKGNEVWVLLVEMHIWFLLLLLTIQGHVRSVSSHNFSTFLSKVACAERTFYLADYIAIHDSFKNCEYYSRDACLLDLTPSSRRKEGMTTGETRSGSQQLSERLACLRR
ncbi:hypothetical protein M8C21_003304 [Ambrosia artemisiifolia]|uniref:Uncharacterized protein n=1 Tax=Ambrosia artemisiifolia TaxID=4212 RepID=A0AAD5GT38_AMBAR|nr:hypothetical protein M8C21_003304 [Ambrosia artemisiifolia]